jgi:hypothetical protein
MSLPPRLAFNAAPETIKGGHQNLTCAELKWPPLSAESEQRLMLEGPTMTAAEAEQRDRQFVEKYRSMREHELARCLTEPL